MPFVVVHALPHAPQLATLVSVFVSQPLRRFPSQLAVPEAHAASVQFTTTLATLFAVTVPAAFVTVHDCGGVAGVAGTLTVYDRPEAIAVGSVKF